MENKKNLELYSIIKEIKIQKISKNQTPISIDGHTSLGPFVRITETGSLNYLYVTAFFDEEVIEGGVEEFDIDGIISNKELSLLIKPKKKTNPKAEKQCLLVFIFTIDDEQMDTVDKVRVTINFNGEPFIKEPRRGTLVIPPNSTIKN
ncbi:hypothetical protein [uncultured Tenacibaculum sp.]|uniref:hypothetical protein n=1 Tax=uncultured Tenacibaculum sp. TaxID=174713 RepID=UPI0026274614|nr:hypothetical protein [uncultured Tenacibaculum sp.]